MKTRIDIIKKYGKGKSVVELGVYAGTFSKQIWHEAKPFELWLVDPWVGAGHCGNDDGTQTDYCANLEDYYLDLVKYFNDLFDKSIIPKEYDEELARGKHINIPNGDNNWIFFNGKDREDQRQIIIKKTTSYDFLVRGNYHWIDYDNVDDGDHDLIYIDADHDPRAVLVDLAMSRIAIKNGGWIAGHDYKDGVKSVVDWFCQTMGYKVFQTTDDKIPSFYFQVTK